MSSTKELKGNIASSLPRKGNSISYPHHTFQHGYLPPTENVDRTNVEGERPGNQCDLEPAPVDDVYADGRPYRGSGKLEGKIALITGGDSGIGRSIAILFALEGADSAIVYLPKEQKDAESVRDYVHKKTEGKRRIKLISKDVRTEEACKEILDSTLSDFGRLDILVNNAAQQLENHDITTLDSKQWEEAFQVNIHPYFYLAKYALPHLLAGSSIINMASINAFIGRPDLIEYTSTKGAIVSFNKALSNQIWTDGTTTGEGTKGKQVRVNAIAPGPIFTPLVPSTFTKPTYEAANSMPLGRIGQPVEVATCAVFLASQDSSYMTGQTLHPNGGVPM